MRPVQSNRLLFAENPCFRESSAQKSVDQIGNNFLWDVVSLSCHRSTDISLLHLEPTRVTRSLSSNFSTQQSPHCAVQSSAHTQTRSKIFSGGCHGRFTSRALAFSHQRRCAAQGIQVGSQLATGYPGKFFQLEHALRWDVSGLLPFADGLVSDADPFGHRANAAA